MLKLERAYDGAVSLRSLDLRKRLRQSPYAQRQFTTCSPRVDKVPAYSALFLGVHWLDKAISNVIGFCTPRSHEETMLTAEDQVKENLRPHPAPGWIAVIPIPGSEIKPDESEEERKPPKAVVRMIAENMNASIEEVEEMMSGESIGQIAAIVHEIGPEHGGMPELPYSEGDTVYFPADRGVEVGEFRFLRWERVICWTS